MCHTGKKTGPKLRRRSLKRPANKEKRYRDTGGEERSWWCEAEKHQELEGGRCSSGVGKNSGNRAGLINQTEHRCGEKNQADEEP